MTFFFFLKLYITINSPTQCASLKTGILIQSNVMKKRLCYPIGVQISAHSFSFSMAFDAGEPHVVQHFLALLENVIETRSSSLLWLLLVATGSVTNVVSLGYGVVLQGRRRALQHEDREDVVEEEVVCTKE